MKIKESTGTVGAAAAGQWADMPVNGTEFYRKLGNKSRPKTAMWDDFSIPRNKSKLNPDKMYGMGKYRMESFSEWLDCNKSI